jgi:uncharacterized membrane protein
MKWIIYGLVIVIGAIVSYAIKNSCWLYTWGFFIGCVVTNVLNYKNK